MVDFLFIGVSVLVFIGLVDCIICFSKFCIDGFKDVFSDICMIYGEVLFFRVIIDVLVELKVLLFLENNVVFFSCYCCFFDLEILFFIDVGVGFFCCCFIIVEFVWFLK